MVLVLSQEIKEKAKSEKQRVELHLLDLSLVKEIESFANKWIKDGKKLDGIVNNAGFKQHLVSIQHCTLNFTAK